MEGQKVGTLAMAKNHVIAFAYDDRWINTGFSISPLSLPLEKRVFLPKGYEPFEGLFGVFSDSLPDGWGRLLVDRLLMREQIDPGMEELLQVAGNIKLDRGKARGIAADIQEIVRSELGSFLKK